MSSRSGLASHPNQMLKYLIAILRSGLFVFYLLILLEGIYMTSFFAVYLFSTYVPIQSLLEQSRSLNWLTDFYLSHFINWSSGGGGGVTRQAALPFNPFHLNIDANRNYFWFIGFFLFFSGAVPIYFGKITGRPAVSGGIYRFIRHPQYLGFAVIGIPFLVIWPRFILLLAYVSMLFWYYLLARRAETLCLERFRPTYQDYLKRTPSMFIPGDHWLIETFRAVYRKISMNGKYRISVLLFVYLLLCLITVKAAYALKHRTVQLLPQAFTENSLAIALQNADRNALAKLVTLAESDPRVTAAVVLDNVGKIHPIVIVGLDLRGPRIVEVVQLKELDPSSDPLRGSRMPLF